MDPKGKVLRPQRFGPQLPGRAAHCEVGHAPDLGPRAEGMYPEYGSFKGSIRFRVKGSMVPK